MEDHAALLRERSQAATAWRGSRTPDEAQERLATLTSLDGRISAKLGEAAELARQLPAVTAELHTEIAALADLGPAINALKMKIGGAVATTGPLVAKLETARDELRETERSLAVNASLVKHLPLIVKSEKHSSLEALGRLRDFNPYTTSGDTVLYREALAALGGDDTIIKATINAFEDLKKAGATIGELEQFLSDAGVPNHWRPVTFVTEVRAFKELTALFEAERAKSAAAPLPEKSIKQKLHASLEGLLAKHGIGVDERQQQALVDLVNLTTNAYDPNDRVLQRMHDEAVLVGMARLVQSGIMGLGTFLPFYKDLSAALSLTDAVVGAAKRYSKASGDGTLVGESRVRDDGFENALMQSQRRENQLLAKHIGDAVVASLGIATLAAAAHPPAAFVLKAVKLGLQGTNVAGHQLYDWSIASKAKALLTLAMSNEPGAAAAQVELFKYSTKYAKGLLALGATKGDSTALHYVASRGLSEDEIASSGFTIIRAFLLEAAAEKDVQQTFGELYADVLSGARSGLGKAWDKVQELVASKPEPKEDEGVELTDLRGRS
ncbi:MAG: hypothetical protein IT381_08340 [Deltaproteobacteria bacterium]|nr:hypothetical protein [Deltaproteobacteria bacterium]